MDYRCIEPEAAIQARQYRPQLSNTSSASLSFSFFFFFWKGKFCHYYQYLIWWLLQLIIHLYRSCTQGRGASRRLHLPGPDRLQPQRERALPPSGAPAGSSLLWRRTHPEVAPNNPHCVFLPPVWWLWLPPECRLPRHCSSQGEECDDMNSMNGDGCSTQCQKEPFFNCVGESRDAARLKGRSKTKAKNLITQQITICVVFFFLLLPFAAYFPNKKIRNANMSHTTTLWMNRFYIWASGLIPSSLFFLKE